MTLILKRAHAEGQEIDDDEEGFHGRDAPEAEAGRCKKDGEHWEFHAPGSREG